MAPKKPSVKGARAEEALRSYFLDLGYFVVRGAKFRVSDYEITDVDLWIYSRPSPLRRERIIVDVKEKRTPQAIERIFWTKGLQEVLGFEHSIVATTDNRPVVREFGRANNVSVLDGNFLKRLISQRGMREGFFTEEEFIARFDPSGLGKLQGDWYRRYQESKSRLLGKLDFSSCNLWLDDFKYFAEQTIVDLQRSQVACRLAYLSCAFFLISLDYLYKDLAFIEGASKETILMEGFTHGSMGPAGLKNLLYQTGALLRTYLPDGAQASETLSRNLQAAFKEVPSNILTEFFSRIDVFRSIFTVAQSFHALAFQRDVIYPADLQNDLKSVIGVLLDFHQIERKKFFDITKKLS